MDTRNTIGHSATKIQTADRTISALLPTIRFQIIQILMECDKLSAKELAVATGNDLERVKAHLGILRKHKIVFGRFTLNGLRYSINRKRIGVIYRFIQYTNHY